MRQPLTTRQDHLDNTLLSGLRERLMDPARFAAFATAFTAGWTQLQVSLSGYLTARQTELVRDGQIDRLLDAIVNSTPVAAINSRMRDLEERHLALEAELENAVLLTPRLHPNLAVVYREKVAALTDALSSSGGSTAMELVCGLVDEIKLVPECSIVRIELRGELASILGLATVAPDRASGLGPAVLSEQIKMVAGTRSHLDLISNTDAAAVTMATGATSQTGQAAFSPRALQPTDRASKAASNASRPAWPTVRARLSSARGTSPRSRHAVHRAAPTAPAMCGRRSLQSRQGWQNTAPL